MRWITSNPAIAAGIFDQTGSIEVGKDADLVIWSGDPFSVYSIAEKVFIDGALAYDYFQDSSQHELQIPIDFKYDKLTDLEIR